MLLFNTQGVYTSFLSSSYMSDDEQTNVRHCETYHERLNSSNSRTITAIIIIDHGCDYYYFVGESITIIIQNVVSLLSSLL